MVRRDSLHVSIILGLAGGLGAQLGLGWLVGIGLGLGREPLRLGLRFQFLNSSLQLNGAGEDDAFARRERLA